jgi:hypothetical protein
MSEKNIIILGLMTGANIIATVEESTGAYLCTDVLEILTTTDEQGNGKMGIVPFMPFASQEGGFAIPTNMAIVATPTQELLDFYKRKFSVIITAPDQKIILG